MVNGRNVDSIFVDAIEIESDAARASYLDEACGDDPELRRQVEALLHAHLQAGDFMRDDGPRRCPQYAERFRHIFAGAANTPGSDGSRSANQPGDSFLQGDSNDPVLGDFRILREIGHGGMGVVYEAEQISLSRKIALKILPFAAVLDDRQLRRFQNEVQAAATLEHPHIVPVYSVGADRGVYYYAMRLIQGPNVSELITTWNSRFAVSARCAASFVGQSARDSGLEPEDAAGTEVSAAESDSRPRQETGLELAASARDSSTVSRPMNPAAGDDRYRTVARLGMHVAEALHHAHEQGILHRDVKPSNLLVDEEGHVWVTDFGLARIEGSKDVTGTGELIGTLQYMSPERVLSKRGLVDQRTDVYSLGATLYELLALRPMHEAEDRTELIRRISEEEPIPPRRYDGRIPRDLETIVLKATSKRVEERYTTAEEMAEDLRRFLEDRPICARVPSFGSRLSKWGRRNRRALATSAAFLLAATGLVMGQLWWERVQFEAMATRETRLRRDAEENLYRTEILLAHEEWREGNIANVLSLLENHVPRPGKRDPRGWEWYYLNSLCHKELATLEGHRGGVTWLAWSPDGLRLATAGADGTVHVWDTATNTTIYVLGRGEKPVWWVAWNPDGSRLFSKCAAGRVQIWNANTGESVGFLGDLPTIWAVSNVDGSRIATIHGDRWVIIWDASEGKELTRWQADLCWGPVALTEKYLVSGEQWPGYLKIFDADTGANLHDVPLLLHQIRDAKYSRDGVLFATASKGGTIRLWDSIEGKDLLDIRAHDALVNQVAWRRDGRRIVTASDDGTIRVLDASNGRQVNILRGHAARIKSVDWHPDGSLVATGDARGMVKLWNPERPQEFIPLKGRTFGIWNPEGTLLVTGGQELGSIDTRSPEKDGKVEIYDTATWESVLTIQDRDFGGTKSADWTSDGRRLAIAGRRGRVKIWEIPSLRELFAVDADSELRGLAFSPDDQWLATVGINEVVNVWDVDQQQRIVSLAGHTDKVGSVAWSPDGRYLASYGWNGEVKIWDVATWREFCELRHRTDESEADGECLIAWSPCGDRLASGTSAGTFLVWDLDSKREVLSVSAHVATIECLAWSPDGRRIATGGDDRTVKIWDAGTGKGLLTLRGHQWPVRGLHWSPDGRWLASGARDGIRIWGPEQNEVSP